MGVRRSRSSVVYLYIRGGRFVRSELGGFKGVCEIFCFLVGGREDLSGVM